MGRIDVNNYFKDDNGNQYNIHMTDHTQGPQNKVLNRLCTFIFDTAINRSSLSLPWWIKLLDNFMYWVRPGCPLFAHLDQESQDRPLRNFLVFKRKDDKITITHFGPFGGEKTWELEKLWIAREKAKNEAKKKEIERKRLEELRKGDYETDFPPIDENAKKSKEWNKKHDAIMEMEAKVLVKVGELVARRKALELAVKAGKDIAEIIAKATAKTAARSGVKKVPVLGLAAGLGFGVWRAVQGDFAGAGMEVVSGAASLVPGVGTAASIGIDAALLGKDIYETQEKVKAEEAKQRALYEAELKELKAQKDAMIRLLEEQIKECKDAEDGYNHCVKACDILIELYEAADGAEK